MDPSSHRAARPLLPHAQAVGFPPTDHTQKTSKSPSEGDSHIPIQSLVQSNVLDLGDVQWAESVQPGLRPEPTQGGMRCNAAVRWVVTTG